MGNEWVAIEVMRDSQIGTNYNFGIMSSISIFSFFLKSELNINQGWLMSFLNILLMYLDEGYKFILPMGNDFNK